MTIESYAIVRADNELKLKTAISDLRKHGKLEFGFLPKQLSPEYADQILVDIMKCELKKQCNIAAVIGLNNSAGAAIDALRKIHPPAHVIIVSNRYEVYEELVDMAPQLPEIEEDGLTVQVSWKH